MIGEILKQRGLKMKAFTGHLNTILTHKKLVFYHARKIGIPFRGFMHDLSKFSPVEFFPGVKYFADGIEDVLGQKGRR